MAANKFLHEEIFRGKDYVKKCRYCRKRMDTHDIYCSKGCKRLDVVLDMERYYDDYGNLTETGRKVKQRISEHYVTNGFEKIQIIKTSSSGKNFEDRSEVYFGETAIVCGVEKNMDSNFKSFIAIRLEIIRPLHEGQKFASRMGQKGMTVQCYRQSDMPFNSRGEIPTLILNPHALPSRMTINQLIEALYPKMGILYGKCFDGTFMIATDIDAVGEGKPKNEQKRQEPFHQITCNTPRL